MKMHNADDHIACEDPGIHKMSTRAFRTLEFTSSKGELVRGDIHGDIHGGWLHKFQKQTCEGTIEGRNSRWLASQVPDANL